MLLRPLTDKERYLLANKKLILDCERTLFTKNNICTNQIRLLFLVVYVDKSTILAINI